MQHDRLLSLFAALSTSALLGCAGRTPQTREVEPATGLNQVSADAHHDDDDDDDDDAGAVEPADTAAAPAETPSGEGTPVADAPAVADATAPEATAEAPVARKAKPKAKPKKRKSKGEAACGEGTCG